MQGKLFQRYTHLLYCSVLSLGDNVNTRRMPKPDMVSIFQIKNQWNILVIGNYYVNYQNYQNLMLLTPWILNEHWCICSCLQIPPRENWFQNVRKVYATAINFPCITYLVLNRIMCAGYCEHSLLPRGSRTPCYWLRSRRSKGLHVAGTGKGRISGQLWFNTYFVLGCLKIEEIRGRKISVTVQHFWKINGLNKLLLCSALVQMVVFEIYLIFRKL